MEDIRKSLSIQISLPLVKRTIELTSYSKGNSSKFASTRVKSYLNIKYNLENEISNIR